MVKGQVTYTLLPQGSLYQKNARAMSDLIELAVRSIDYRQQGQDKFLEMWYGPKIIMASQKPLEARAFGENFETTSPLKHLEYYVAHHKKILVADGILSHAINGGFLVIEGPYVHPLYQRSEHHFGPMMLGIMVDRSNFYAEKYDVHQVQTYAFPLEGILNFYETKGFKYGGEIELVFRATASESAQLKVRRMELDLTKKPA